MSFRKYVPGDFVAMSNNLYLKPIDRFDINLTDLETIDLHTPDVDRRLPWLATSFGMVLDWMA